MDYEKKYNEALALAKEKKEIASRNGADITVKFLEEIFPELRESEDERIRKWLLELVEEQEPKMFIEVKKMDVFAWLEKQKEPHYTKRNELFDKCVENCDPEVMKEVSDKVDEMLQKEQKVDIDKLRRDIYQSGYNDGYQHGKEDAEEAYNKSVAYHYPTMPQRPLCWEPGGTCTNPQMDCINCPRKTTGWMFTTPNTASGTSSATLQGNTSVTDGKEHNPSFTD